MKNIELNLSHMADGAIQEKLDGELEKIFDNIHDLNTPAKAKRVLTIKLEFVPDDSRQVVSVASDFTTKLAPVEGVATTVLTGKDIKTGKIEAKELKSGKSGQAYMDVTDGLVKSDTGEPFDVIERESRNRSNIVDLQKKA